MPSASYAVPPKVTRIERTVRYVRPSGCRSVSPGSRSVWTNVSVPPVPVPVLAFGTPPRTPRGSLAPLPAFCPVAVPVCSRPAPATPITSWRLCPAPAVQSTQVHPDQFKARRHSVPWQTSARDDVENRPIKTEGSKVPLAEQDSQQSLAALSSISARKSGETLSTCFSNGTRTTTSTWTSPLMTSRLTRTGSPLFSTPQMPQRTVRKSEALRFFPAAAPVKVAAPDVNHMATIDRVRAEMMNILEERERCHQKQLSLMQDFQQAREREHAQQLQHMREMHKADMQRLEEKLSQLLRRREAQAAQAAQGLAKSAQTLTESSSAAVEVRGSTADEEEEEEDTLLYTEPSMDHTLSPIAAEVDRSPDAAAAGASPLLSEASFPSSAVLGSEGSPLSRTIKLLPPHYPQVPTLPRRNR